MRSIEAGNDTCDSRAVREVTHDKAISYIGLDVIWVGHVAEALGHQLIDRSLGFQDHAGFTDDDDLLALRGYVGWEQDEEERNMETSELFFSGNVIRVFVAFWIALTLAPPGPINKPRLLTSMLTSESPPLSVLEYPCYILA
jgi:hypothetical protein